MNIQNILKAGAIVAITAKAATTSVAEIKTVNSVATYPDDYNGRPVCAANEDPFLSLLNSALILIDYQPGVLWLVTSIDHEELLNNTEGLIKPAVLYDIPIIFSHVAVGFSGYELMIEELSKLAPNAIFVDRTSVNAWEEPEFVAAVKATGVEAITWNLVPTEFQRDHARQKNLGGLMEIFGTHLFYIYQLRRALALLFTSKSVTVFNEIEND